MAAFVLDANLRIANVLGLEQVKQKLAGITGVAGGAAVGGGAGAGTAATAQAVAGATALASANDKLVNANKKVAASSKAANNAIGKTAKATEEGARSAQNFGQQIRFAGKRYLAFVTATAVPFAVIGLFREATQSVIEFDAAVTKVRQITGQTVEGIAELKQQFIDLSVQTGTSSTELANASKTLAQAGIRGKNLSNVMDQITKIPLTPTFGSISAGIEGLLAITNQYNIELSRTEEIYDVLTQVGNEFAASAEDLFGAFARGGAAFKAIGGTFKEFAAVAAVVRQETRESASAVGTFLKTISSRLADPKILEFLRGKGIELLGPTGQFVGPIEALHRISDALKDIVNIQDKVEIAVKIAGRRQVSRLLAAVNAIDEIDRGLNVANNSAGAFSRIAEEGLKTVEKQIAVLVAELNKLFQTLAEPVIIPLIQGFTTAAKAAISLIDAISPVIPLFTELAAVAIGIKALTLAMTSLGAISAKVAAVQFTGLAGLAGGLGGGQAISNRIAFGSSRGAAIGGGAAIAAASRSFVDSSKAVAKSYLGQIAIIGAASLGVGYLGEMAEEAGHSVTAMALEASEAALKFAVVASLITGKGAGALFKTPLGLIGAAAAALGAGIYYAGQQARKAMEEIGRKTAEKISQIKIDTTVTGSLEEGIKEFSQNVSDKIKKFADEFRGVSGGTRTIKQFLAKFSEDIGGFISGERGLFDPTISIEKIRKNIEEAFKGNTEFLDTVLHESIDTFGSNFKEGLKDFFKKAFLNLGATPEEAEKLGNEFKNAALKVAGNEKIMSATVTRAARTREASEKSLNNVIKKATGDISAIEIPTQISFELQALSEAVRRTVQSVDDNVRLFDALSGAIGKIGVPKIELGLTDVDLRELFVSGGAEKILGPELENVGQFTKDTLAVKETLKDLFAVFTSGETAAIIQNQIRGGTREEPVTQPLSQMMDELIKEFIELRELSPSAEAAVRTAGKRFVDLMKKSVTSIINPEELEKAFKEILGQRIEVSGRAIEGLRSFLESLQEAANLEIDRMVIGRRTRAERTSPKGIIEELGNLSKELGAAIEPTLNFAYGVESISNNLGAISNLAIRTANNLEEIADAFAKISDPANLANIQENIQSYLRLGEEQAALEEANTLLLRSIELEKAGLIELARKMDDPDRYRGAIEHLDGLMFTIRRRLKEIEADAAVRARIPTRDKEGKPVDVFEGATKTFHDSVIDFNKGVELITGKVLRPKKPEEFRPEEVEAVEAISPRGAETFRHVGGRIIPDVKIDKAQMDKLIASSYGAADIKDLKDLIARFNRSFIEFRETDPVARERPGRAREFLAKQLAASAIESQVAAGAIGPEDIDRVTKNLEDLLLGKIKRIPERIPKEELKQAEAFAATQVGVLEADTRKIEVDAQVAEINAAKATRETRAVREIAGETGPSIMGPALTPNERKAIEEWDERQRQQTQIPTGLDEATAGEAQSAAEHSRASAALAEASADRAENIVNQADVNIDRGDISDIDAPTTLDSPDTVKQLESFRKEYLGTSNQLIGLQQQQLNEQQSTTDKISQTFTPGAVDFVVPGMSTALSAGALGAVEPTTIQPAEAIIDNESATKIAQSAEQLTSASQTTSENLNLTTSAFQLSVDGFNTAVQTFGDTINQMSAVPNIAQEAQIEQPMQNTIVSDELVAVSRENTEVLRSMIESVQLLSQSINQGAEQEQDTEPLKVENIEIEGLAAANQITSRNTEALSQNVSEMSELSNQLVTTEQALEKGLNVELTAMQQLVLDIEGLDGAVEELKPEFTEVAVKAAKLVVKQALIDLADTLSNAELSTSVNNVANNI